MAPLNQVPDMPNQGRETPTDPVEPENGAAPAEASRPRPGASGGSADAGPPIHVDVIGGEATDLAARGFADAVPRRVGNDLTLTRADGRRAVLADFFVAAQTGAVPDLLRANGLPAVLPSLATPRVPQAKSQAVWSTGASTTIELPLLDPDESRRLCARVMSHSAHFQSYPPSALGTLKTLGPASYLEVKDDAGRARYLRDAGDSNALLLDAFGPLYEQVVQAVSAATGQPAFTTARYAVPGFHVFDPFTYAKAHLKRPHFDTHYPLLDPSYRLTPDNTRHHLTITLVIAEPPGGAFVKYYGVDLRDRLLRDAGAPGQSGTRRRKSHRYAIGKLVLTIGLPLHQIWPLKDERAPGLRVSLQGHGVLHDGGWELFW